MPRVSLNDFISKMNATLLKLKAINSNLLKENTSPKAAIDAISHLQSLKEQIDIKINELKKMI